MSEAIPMDLPLAWADYSAPVESFDPFHLLTLLGNHDARRLTLRAQSVVNVRRSNNTPGPPRVKATLRDAAGHAVVMVAFGDCADVLAELESEVSQRNCVDLEGLLKPMGKTFLLASPSVVRSQHVGRIVPLYPPTGRGRKPRPRHNAVTPDELSAQAAALFEEAFARTPNAFSALTGLHIDRAQEYISRALLAVHQPTAIDTAYKAVAALDQIGAWIAVRRAHLQSLGAAAAAQQITTTLSIEDLERRAGFPLTQDQRSALQDILSDIGRAKPAHRLLTGDTGSGKTAVYGLAAVAAAHAGYTVAVLVPSEYLARQVQRSIDRWAGPVGVQLLVAGTALDPSSRIIVGTTALLHVQALAPDLVIVDEQQAFSVSQRNALRDRRAGLTAHLIEVTATCIPRTQAIAQLGFISVSRLLNTHVERQITTTHYNSKQGRDLFDAVTKTVVDGGRVLVIYPAKSDEVQLDATGRPIPLMSLGTERAVWERHFPSLVCVAYAGQDDERAGSNQAAIDQFASGEKKIMLATVVMERGHDIPGLRHVVIVQPERMGLMQMHQIRGRAARDGGCGRCDLYSPLPVTPSALSRIRTLMETSSGWDIAAADLSERGCGDLSDGSTQHGSIQSPFRGRPIAMVALERAAQVLELIT